VPGHSIDSVVYAMELNGKRVIFTGDSFLENTLYHCWGDVEKAKILTELLRSRVLPIKPEFAFMGHISEKNAEEFLLKVLKASEEKINAALRKGDEQK
ncbi:MAG: MBL fold metallo-hydrolase, partial [Armatimonadota bacterium]|nr:MBL fold metallo-hydrolase [Armatimonadota bacterium]